ncbi:PAS domain S-box protein [Clostridium chauvoei]|nr:PAS domain S-box protein [Clostridium chauvoei]MBX7311847.1 PAS domain S-box protein [Clostridium chauvoei]MBX7316873.1 PAS domain S-box protein [Clostridium chauvoei]MBX7344597.1 PAS domain S-box protein [Clostridium chauvoei]MBX7362247.1 PAS domain S-box protein [Clostridium chauvoei]MBX7364766.1 PAS domain S-box protein [Clostridium chauvoei]
MTFSLAEKKENKELKHIIITIIASIALVTIALIIKFFFTKGIEGPKIAFLNNIEAINDTLAIISILSCWLYYYMHKKPIFFIITLIYISFGVEYIYVSLFLSESKESLLGIVPVLISTYLFRSILILFTILKSNKITEKLCRNKMISIILTSIVTIGLLSAEVNYINLNSIRENSNFVIFMSVIMIIYHFFILSILALRSIEEVEFIYTIIISSISIFTIKRIYSLGHWNGHNCYISSVCKLLTFLGFFILLVGVFIEIIRKVRENELLKQELKVFYDLTEYNQHNNVVIFNGEKKPVYANARVRYSSSKFSTKNVKKLSCLENLSLNKISEEQSNVIYDRVTKDSFYKGVVLCENNNALKLDVQKIKVNTADEVFVATYRDITKDYKMNEQLKINESKLKSITENIKDLILMIDMDENITYVNNAVIELLGYKKEELLNSKYSLILEKKNSIDIISKNLKESPYKEHKLICKNNKEIYVESIISQVESNNVESAGYIIVARDLTYRNELESLKIKYKEMKEYERIRKNTK